MSIEKDLNIVLAGFGGQGILFAGKVLAYAGLHCRIRRSPGFPPMVRKCGAVLPIAVFAFPTNPLARPW